MVDGLHILTRNRTKKPLATALRGVGRVEGERRWGQCKSIWNCPNDSPCTTNISYKKKKKRKARAGGSHL
jgi:hypothetical protein